MAKRRSRTTYEAQMMALHDLDPIQAGVVFNPDYSAKAAAAVAAHNARMKAFNESPAFDHLPTRAWNKKLNEFGALSYARALEESR